MCHVTQTPNSSATRNSCVPIWPTGPASNSSISVLHDREDRCRRCRIRCKDSSSRTVQSIRLWSAPRSTVRDSDQHRDLARRATRWVARGPDRTTQATGIVRIPAVVRELSDRESLAIALVENVQREDLNAIDEARSLARLIKEFDLMHQGAADAFGCARATISNILSAGTSIRRFRRWSSNDASRWATLGRCSPLTRKSRGGGAANPGWQPCCARGRAPHWQDDESTINVGVPACIQRSQDPGTMA